MSTNQLLKQLWVEKREFITSEELIEYSKALYFNYSNNMIKYLISRGYLLKIFKNIFYVKSRNEFQFNKIRYSPLELVLNGLKLKRVRNWYFGLYTALTLNGITNNHDQEFYVINNKIVNHKPIKIGHYTLNFLILKSRLLNFGIIKNKIQYSDLEKTILDFIYLWKINKKTDLKIIRNITKFIKNISKDKITKYSNYYPESNRKILEKLIE
ncbi:MAG: hypothetical protein ACFFDO_07760 [Candidatus Thorarchaeota archaeon]